MNTEIEKRFVYADNAATTPVLPAVLDAMMPMFGEVYGNPSSLYEKGQEALSALTAAREKIASLLGCKPGRSFSPPAAPSRTTGRSRARRRRTKKRESI